MNLLKETQSVLLKNGKTLNDIKWIGTLDYKIDMAEFIHYADTEYDNGVGDSEVATDLLIVGENWVMRRNTDEIGNEKWIFDHEDNTNNYIWDITKKLKIKEPDQILDIKALTVDQNYKIYGEDNLCHVTLKGLNRSNNENWETWWNEEDEKYRKEIEESEEN